MKDDLLDAQAAVDWAKSNFPAFAERLESWNRNNIRTMVRELPSDNPQDLLIAVEKEPLPLIFNVEAGAYINAIRSSLDMVAWAVYKREPFMLHPRDVFFPIANSVDDFASGNYTGSKFIGQLCRTNRELFESCEPYKGANNPLFALHNLDIIRKHKRVLQTYQRPGTFHVTGWGIGFSFPGEFIDAGNGETVLGFVNKGSEPKVAYRGNIVINEPEFLPPRAVIIALQTFASNAEKVIGIFDV